MNLLYVLQARAFFLSKYRKGLKDLCSILLAIFIFGSPFFDALIVHFIDVGVGKNNRYGFPSNAIIERFKRKKILLYRTDIDGTIIIQTEGNIMSIEKGSDKNYF